MGISGGTTAVGAGIITGGSGSGGGDIEGGMTGSGFAGGITIGRGAMQPHSPTHSIANTVKQLGFTVLLDLRHDSLINGTGRRPLQGIHGA